MLVLGSIPGTIRVVVRRLVAETRPDRPNADDRLNGFLLTGGPGGCSFLYVDGQVWNRSWWDESVEVVPDGPVKVGLVAIAAERVPELAAWLPARPAGASGCVPCIGSGCLKPPLAPLQCPECSGMGWVQAASQD